MFALKWPECCSLTGLLCAFVRKGHGRAHGSGCSNQDAGRLVTAPVLLKQGLVKLADFGVASRLGEIADEEDPAAIAVVGTPYWMAPEVRVPSVNSSAKRDVWCHCCADGESAVTI